MPTGKAYEKFSGLIKKLAAEYNAPVFEPHVTLLGDVPQPEEVCVSLTKQLVSGQKPFTITMGDIDYEDFYFRTLFVKSLKTEPLLTLHNKAKEIFKMDIPPFMPHLSLLYGTFPVATKEKIIKEIGRNQPARFLIDRVYLIKGGKLADWQITAQFPFTRTP